MSASPLAQARVFVTGADGFIGSHLVEALVRQGAQVRALVLYNSWNSVGWLAELPDDVASRVEIVPGDIRDRERIASCVRDCAYVFHLSSLIGIPYSYEAARSYVDVNVTGALNVLESCKAEPALRCLLHVSTSEVYGSAQIVPIPESHPLVGQSPYSATKIAADKLAESYFLSFRTPVVVARPFNTYGPRQTARAVIPTIASQLLAGTPKLKLGSLEPTRDFNYVTDTAAGMLALATCPAAIGQTVNIGTGEEWSIGQTAKMLMELCGRAAPIETDDRRVRPEASEVSRLCADATLIRRLTGWKPEVPFREGLRRTVEWIGKNADRFAPTRYSV
jgi:NAD dependent epimerase/dehydratase